MLTHGFSSKWNYLMRTTPIDPCLLQPLENVTRHKFLPAITGKKGAFSDTGRALLALLVRLGGLGIVNPTTVRWSMVPSLHSLSHHKAAWVKRQQPCIYKRLAYSFLSSKRSAPYSRTINWIRCRIGFALLWLMIMCLRGASSSHLYFIRDSA